MRRPLGSRTLIAICGLLAILLAAVAVVQYRWSTRVAAADAQREKEYLDSGSALFANQFNDAAVKTVEFMQNDAWSAFQSGEKLSGVPPMIGELYYFETRPEAAVPGAVKQLNSAGIFVPVEAPSWIPAGRCGSIFLEQPLAMVAPIFNISSIQNRLPGQIRVMSSVATRPAPCFVAKLNEGYLKETLFPQLIRSSFGETGTSNYEFSVLSRLRNGNRIYGPAVNPDLRKQFFAVSPIHMRSLHGSGNNSRAIGAAKTIFFERFVTTTTLSATGNLPPGAALFGDGVWELDVAHRGLPLAASFEQTRRRNMMVSIAVETLLVAAIVFLVMATRRMQHLAEQKMQFVATVSHELRTPVSAISMLSRNQADGLVAGPEKVKQYGELMHQQSRRLNEMVEQTLQYAGIHSGLPRLAKSEIALRALVEEAMQARRESLAHGGFEVEIDVSPDLPRVLGDAKLLRIAFDNLLSNAEKYAGSGHWIRVSATCAAPGKEVLLSVEDRGPGIPPADHEEIFEPFSRGQAAIESQIPGSGIGLSLVRSAAQAHRGSVTLVSEPGRGSKFTLHLPV